VQEVYRAVSISIGGSASSIPDRGASADHRRLPGVVGSGWFLGTGRAWGGEYDDLPARLQVSSGISAIVLAAAAVIVVGRAGIRLLDLPNGVLHWGTWVIVALTGLSALANFASSSDWERFMNGPIALLVAILCIAVARSAVSPLPDDD
jgi:hypothetical protein